MDVRTPRPRLVPPLAWLLLALAGWTGVAVIGLGLGARAGDDLRLLVDAGARVRAGLPLYVEPGGSLDATTLFYSYPPLVAQAFALLADVPFAAILVAWSAGAVASLVLVARRVAGPAALLPVLALVPFAWPFAIALLFGNLNAWFPCVFGLVLLGLIAPGRATTLGGGIALGVATAAKLHPASIGAWLLVRGLREGHGAPAWRLLGVAVAAGAVSVAASLAVGGTGPWLDWLAFLRSGAGSADLVHRLNIGPASQAALLFGLDDAAARSLQAGVTAAALAATVLVAWRVRDSVESLGWAITASLVVLPVTWFHYPAALLPIAIAALARRGTAAVPDRVTLLLGVALVLAALAIAIPVAVWGAVLLVLAAARASRPQPAARSTAVAAGITVGIPAVDARP